jgi:hypothetical protein
MEGKMGRKFSLMVLFVVIATIMCSCATSPYGYDRIATTSFGLGALGTAIGYAVTGDPRYAAIGGASGLVGGYLLGQAIENAAPVYVEPPPTPGYYSPSAVVVPPPPVYYRPRVIVVPPPHYHYGPGVFYGY